MYEAEVGGNFKVLCVLYAPILNKRQPDGGIFSELDCGLLTCHCPIYQLCLNRVNCFLF